MAPIVIKLGGYQKPASVHSRAAVCFGEALADILGECIRFELAGDVLALGRQSGDLPRMVANGELSLCYISTVRFTRAVPEFQILELPFVVPDRDTACRALDGELGDLWRERMHAATPFRLLGLWDNGFRHLSNKIRPIRAPADCRGLRIRTQMSELHGETFRALGFEPVPADVKEFVEQIGSDRFQAQDNPLTNIFNFGVHRHHRYITLSGHFFGASAFICNQAHYSGWPPQVQEAVEAAAREATALQRRLAAAEDDEIMARLDPHHNDIVRLTDDERAAFVRATHSVVARYRNELDPRLFRYLERQIAA
ncbi:MAG: TRAP transporter substrate-binding protein [Burkholderiales bacterium]